MKLMAMIYQLNPAVLVETPMGMGNASYIVEYGLPQSACWIVTLLNGGIVKQFESKDIIQRTTKSFERNLLNHKVLQRIEQKIKT